MVLHPYIATLQLAIKIGICMRTVAMLVCCMYFLSANSKRVTEKFAFRYWYDFEHVIQLFHNYRCVYKRELLSLKDKYRNIQLVFSVQIMQIMIMGRSIYKVCNHMLWRHNSYINSKRFDSELDFYSSVSTFVADNVKQYQDQ